MLYQTIAKPIRANNRPLILSWLTGNFSITFNIFFIFDGNKAYKMPSINNKRPIAMMSSFIEQSYCSLMTPAYCSLMTPAFPKNLKKSLSGDKIKVVSPPIKAVS